MEYVLFICSLRVCLYCSDYLVMVASQMYITVCMIVQVNKAVDLQRSVKSLNYSLQETLSELLRLKKEILKSYCKRSEENSELCYSVISVAEKSTNCLLKTNKLPSDELSITGH